MTQDGSFATSVCHLFCEESDWKNTSFKALVENYF